MPTKDCPHAKSEMTPCVLRDGPICFAMDSRDQPICVGCERPPEQLGVPRPKDWDEQVKRFYAKPRRKK